MHCRCRLTYASPFLLHWLRRSVMVDRAARQGAVREVPLCDARRFGLLVLFRYLCWLSSRFFPPTPVLHRMPEIERRALGQHRCWRRAIQLRAMTSSEEQTRKSAEQSQRWQEMQEQFRRDSERSLLRRAWDALFDAPRRS
jgi:hypothetical protein